MENGMISGGLVPLGGGTLPPAWYGEELYFVNDIQGYWEKNGKRED